MQVAIGLAVVAIVLALAAMGLGLLGTAVGHAPTLQFAEFYQGGGARGLILSDKLVALHGQRVVMAGFMAPPLKPALDFFVLTRVPLALCPFCASDTQWPAGGRDTRAVGRGPGLWDDRPAAVITIAEDRGSKIKDRGSILHPLSSTLDLRSVVLGSNITLGNGL